ncbi:hypothetical protein [Leptospira interrogans]|uniref:hypothetical protein n=1 Tax=Leptospira interrogans TaxID=173 RepID=UPI0002BE7808|nr:hypothetical protein [Leptospira interrogans]EMO94306.1 hypothetical protein LEP1GSC109_2991 [Leptospira interrogans str. UI 13372]
MKEQILNEILEERKKQDQEWGEQSPAYDRTRIFKSPGVGWSVMDSDNSNLIDFKDL